MKRTFLLVAILVLTSYCVAQQPSLADHGVRNLMTEIERASQAQDGRGYALTFHNDARWEGPRGQFAAGRDNIQQAADLMFRTFGPLQRKGWTATPLSADVVTVDMYQKVVSDRSPSPQDVPTASGSATAPRGSDIRTTLILKRQNQRWTVVAAWVADIRLSKGEGRSSLRRSKW